MSKQYREPVDFASEVDDESSTLTLEDIGKIVLSSSDWTTETILSQLARNNIDLNPRFQRRDAWTRPRKSRLIESLILGLPVPEIVLAEKHESKGKYIVLDGKQRLLTLLQFTGNAEGNNNSFALTGLDVRTDLNAKTYMQIQKGLFEDDIDSLNNSTIRAVVIRNWTKQSLLHMVFHRLNTGSVSLSPQELRQALLPGRFIDFADDQAAKSLQLQRLLNNTDPDFRMRDVELLIRFYAFALFLPEYSGNMRDFLDFTCDRLNSGWSNYEHTVLSLNTQFDSALKCCQIVFGQEHVGRKWDGSGYEPRLNRALLDVLLFYFANPRIRSIARKRKKSVLRAFQTLCHKNAEFRDSIEFTTKSLKAVATRLDLWGQALKKATGFAFAIPQFDEESQRLRHPIS